MVHTQQQAPNKPLPLRKDLGIIMLNSLKTSAEYSVLAKKANKDVLIIKMAQETKYNLIMPLYKFTRTLNTVFSSGDPI